MVAAPPDAVDIQPIRTEGELMQALAIREVVFIEEQHVPEGIERDAEDAKAYHVLAFSAGHAVGTGRLVALPTAPEGEAGAWAQIGRMAVLQAHRKFGLGSRILAALEAEARRTSMNGILMHAQLYALEFYRRHGYQPVGPVFVEAGIDHVEMRRRLDR